MFYCSTLDLKDYTDSPEPWIFVKLQKRCLPLSFTTCPILQLSTRWLWMRSKVYLGWIRLQRTPSCMPPRQGRCFKSACCKKDGFTVHVFTAFEDYELVFAHDSDVSRMSYSFLRLNRRRMELEGVNLEQTPLM